MTWFRSFDKHISFRSPVLSVVIIAAICLLITSYTYAFSYDDAYITFRYSFNLATGQGFNYQPGETILGTTAPYYAFLLGLLGMFDPSKIPLISGWLNGLGLFAAASAIFLYAFGRKQALVGFWVALTFISMPMLLDMFGGEVIPLTAIILWAFIAYEQKKFGLAGLLLGLGAGIRGDAIIATTVLGGYYLIKYRKIPWHFGIGFTFGYGPWAVFSFIQYGVILPGTLSAKIAQGESGYWSSLSRGSLHVFRMFLGEDLIFGPAAHAIFRLYVILIPFGFISVLSRSRYWLLLLISAALQLLGYIFLGVPFYHWYIAPGLLIVAILTGTALGAIPPVIETIFARLSGEKGRTPIWIGVFTSLMIIGPVFWEGILFPIEKRLAIQNPEPAKVYTEIGEWLNQNSDKDATVGYLEIGYIGYYAQREMIDPLGLITPGMEEAVRAGDLANGYRLHLPDYIVDNPRFDGMLSPYKQEPWFANCYNPKASFNEIIIVERCAELAEEDMVVLVQSQPYSDRSVGEIVPDFSVGQTFIPRHDELRALAFLLANYGREVNGLLVFHLQYLDDLDLDRELVRIEIRLEEIRNNEWKVISFSPIMGVQGKTLYAYLEAPDSTAGNAITAWATVSDSYHSGQLMVNNEIQEGDLAFRLYYVEP